MPLQPPSPFHQHIALPERTALLLSMLAPWPRRGRELLVIGCGRGMSCLRSGRAALT